MSLDTCATCNLHAAIMCSVCVSAGNDTLKRDLARTKEENRRINLALGVIDHWWQEQHGVSCRCERCLVLLAIRAALLGKETE